MDPRSAPPARRPLGLEALLVLAATAACAAPRAGGEGAPSPGSEASTSLPLTVASVEPVAPASEAPRTRAIRRDVPLTDAIRRAYDAGTRSPDGRPGPNYWQLRTDFTIDVRLDPAAHTLTGRETIVVHNTSPDELNTLSLRLDHNLFRARASRGSSIPAEVTEGMVVTRLAVDGQEADLSGARGRRAEGPARPRVQGLESTLAKVLLVDKVPPGGVVSVEVEWHTALPGGDDGRGHRMTQRFGETLFQPTQWFPRLAKYDDLRGWDQNPYLGPAEFYNNYGRFDVRIDVPAGWLVSGTGVLQNPEEVLTDSARERLARVLDSDALSTIVGEDETGPGRATKPGERLVWRFLAEDVNDFAWATADRYVWKATRATIPGRGPIPVHILHLPERARRFQKADELVRHALEYYSALWLPYAYPQLTMQDGPSDGMEYPMVINSSAGAADHETAHQWWPMMVGTNETWYGWMDEGLNVYMNVLSDAHRDGQPADFDGRGRAYGRVSGNESEPPMMWCSNYAGPMTGFQTYEKATMMLSMLGGIVGDHEVQRAVREYAETWRFKHPSPWDFMACVSRSLDRDLGWFWYAWLFTTESVDGALERVTPLASGAEVVVRQDGAMPSPVVLKVSLAAGGPRFAAPANARWLDDDTLLYTWPVEVWFDGRPALACTLDTGGRAVVEVALDPYGRFPDGEADDNVWHAGP